MPNPLFADPSPVRAIHFESHTSLLRPFRATEKAQLDAIVVPATRPAAKLQRALSLGGSLRVLVVALCSHDSKIDEVIQEAKRAGTRCIAVDTSDAVPEQLLTFETSKFRQATDGAVGDLSFKRNVGLVLGRSLEWRKLLFLDDDISVLDPDRVSQAASALANVPAVGMLALDYPDNSIVCHAHRLSGGYQQVFVSGSALAVDPLYVDSFFPEIYNEDWLFLAPAIDRRHVAYQGSVRQDDYSPFEDLSRAACREFGDVVAEGLIGYLHSARMATLPSADYWQCFLHRRAEFIDRTRRDCLDESKAFDDATSAVRALDCAADALSKISAKLLTEYTAAWRDDVKAWGSFLMAFRRTRSVVAVLRELGLHTFATSGNLGIELGP